MKKLKKVLKILVITIVSLVAFVYLAVFLGHKVIFPEKTATSPAIQEVKNAQYSFGAQVHPNQPKTMEQYVQVLAAQVKQYNKIAPTLWPDNATSNQSAIVEDYQTKKSWLIQADGQVKELSKKELEAYGSIRMPYAVGFNKYKDGIYLPVSTDDLNNYLAWDKYLHLGTYDEFITFSHELFHMKEQPKWKEMNDVPNTSRDEFTNDTAARAKRALLQQQLLAALREPENHSLVLDALATYKDWQKEFPDDYKNSVYFDRIEGTAFYYELVSSLYSAYPNEVKNAQDIKTAMALLATREDIYVAHGLVTEGYNVGGFSGILLDNIDPNWKQKLMNDPQLTPIELLYQENKNQVLPKAKVVTQEQVNQVKKAIEDEAQSNRPASLVFRSLYDILY